MYIFIEPFEIEYDYFAGEDATYDQPSVREQVDIYSVVHKGEELIDYIGKDIISLWNDHIIEHLEATKYD